MKIPVLDGHGYVEFVESWGSDERVIESARMSTQGGFVSWEPYEKHPRGDQGLLEYLWKNGHATPFEMAGMTIEVRAPIAVFREWMRHRVPFGYSEASARYGSLPALDYRPAAERVLEGGGHLTKQAGRKPGAPAPTPEVAEEYRRRLAGWQADAIAHYEWAVDNGVAFELARGFHSVFRHSTMRVTGNLRGWLTSFLAQRLPTNAQKEIRLYAGEVGKIAEELFPRTWGLFSEGMKR